MTPEENDKVKSLTDSTDVFNYVIDHLKKLGKRKQCAYRGDGGIMCAVGCLMTDDEYDSTWENRGIGVLVEQNLLTTDLNNRIKPNLQMLADLQRLHDNYLEYKDGEFTEDVKIHIGALRVKWDIE